MLSNIPKILDPEFHDFIDLIFRAKRTLPSSGPLAAARAR
jgi:hypothetical protein